MPGGDELETKVSRQVEAAVREADVVLFVVDASVGLTDDDQTIANWIRRSGTQVIVVANKADNERRETEMWEFMSLGIGEPVPVSALHGRLKPAISSMQCSNGSPSTSEFRHRSRSIRGRPATTMTILPTRSRSCVW